MGAISVVLYGPLYLCTIRLSLTTSTIPVVQLNPKEEVWDLQVKATRNVERLLVVYVPQFDTDTYWQEFGICTSFIYRLDY